MKLKLHNWLRKELAKLVLWAAGDSLVAQAKQDGYVAGRNAALRLCDELRAQMQALQMLDVQFNGSGKIIIAAKVQGRDIVQIIDVPANCSWEEWRHRAFEIKQKFGAEIAVRDLPTGYPRGMFDYNPKKL